MQIFKLNYRNGVMARDFASPGASENNCQLVLVFGGKMLISDQGLLDQIRQIFPKAAVISSSSAGEISGYQHFDDAVVIVGLHLEHTRFVIHSCVVEQSENSYAAGHALVNGIDPDDLAYILVLSDGLIVNGSQLIRGMESANTARVLITGGLAADHTTFDFTVVGIDGLPEKGKVAAIAFYGKRLQVSSHSVNGWDEFGPERLVTRSEGSRLYQVDHEPVIDLYKIYVGGFMGDRANTTLLFPLAVKFPGNSFSLVRSIHSIDHEKNCLLLTGDIPEGSVIRFMRAGNEKMVAAASQAASLAKNTLQPPVQALALVVSCAGRKGILESRIEEETEQLHEILGDAAVIAGFYSYGELAPVQSGGRSELHNQTISITVIGEQ